MHHNALESALRASSFSLPNQDEKFVKNLPKKFH
jgi:hypothetical protein